MNQISDFNLILLKIQFDLGSLYSNTCKTNELNYRETRDENLIRLKKTMNFINNMLSKDVNKKLEMNIIQRYIECE
jgi:hypothetical protein